MSERSATSFDVAAAGSSPSAVSARDAAAARGRAGAARLPPCVPSACACSSSVISLSAASAQPDGAPVEPHTSAAPPARRSS
eukprot:6019016-Pleurochrysis_carterae.AAC.1